MNTNIDKKFYAINEIHKKRDTGIVYFNKGYGFFAITNKEIANLLDLTLENYIKLMLSYGAFKDDYGDYIFHSVDKAKAFANYLNDQYLVILKLSGKV